MPDPDSQDEFNAKAMRNSQITGYGAEVTHHFPCPGCAEPDWKLVRIINAANDMQTNAKCKHCERSFKVIVDNPNPGSLHFEFVQTGGDDLPEWYEPRPRRV